MSEIIIGKCPECGCPIYQEEYWAGSGHAPAIYICRCQAEPQIRADERAETLREVGNYLEPFRPVTGYQYRAGETYVKSFDQLINRLKKGEMP